MGTISVMSYGSDDEKPKVLNCEDEEIIFVSNLCKKGKLKRFIAKNKVDRIVFSPNDVSITVSDQKQIDELIDIISDVKLKESKNPELEGGLSIEFYSSDEKVSITVMSGYILTDNKAYSTDRDITAELRKYYAD